MARNRIKVVLNSRDIGALLKNDETIAEIIEDSAEPVEKNMEYFVKKNNALYKANTENKNSPHQGGQSVSSELVKETDRQKVEVSVNNAKYSDFKYNTVQKSVSRAKGEY